MQQLTRWSAHRLNDLNHHNAGATRGAGLIFLSYGAWSHLRTQADTVLIASHILRAARELSGGAAVASTLGGSMRGGVIRGARPRALSLLLRVRPPGAGLFLILLFLSSGALGL